MLIREKLQDHKFSNTEKEVVRYVLEQKLAIKNMTIKEIANATYAAPSTLLRIAHKLNYDGWNELKEAYIQEEEYLQSHFTEIDPNIPFDRSDDIMSISGKIAKLEIEAIEDSLSLLKYEDLQKAVTILQTSKCIHVFGVADNYKEAETFKYYMFRINKQVQIHFAQSEMAFAAYMIQPDECAIAISYTGETVFLLEPLKTIKDRGIPIIAITSIGGNSLSNMADCTLNISTREKMLTKIATYVNDTSIGYILDVLYSCVFSHEYEKNLKFKLDTSRIIEKNRISTNKVISE